ncbi:MmgE/PrpD family protein [Thioclava sp. GXIMD2076]|uniref:MmgE/PrpD family protein n=1 Tax=Thioclava sp. GXIMD2076 TaxID=3131931 RepID=UPI0030CB0A43
MTLPFDPPTGLAPRLSLFASETPAEAIPDSVMQSWVLHLIDTLACAAAGSRLPLAQSVATYARQQGSGRPLIGGGSSGPMLAAFANAFAANLLDFDDGFEHDGKGMGHPGASLVAAGLAALGDAPVTGRAFLTALVLGAEINNRLILSVQPSAKRFVEVYGIGQHQSVGAAVTYARLKGLGAPQMSNALNLAASLSAVPSLHKYNWFTRPIISLKDFVAPSAQAGVQGVDLALAGLQGPADIFEGPQGFWRMVGSDHFAPDLLTEGLGHDWYAGDGAVKTYPACRWIAPVLEAFDTVLAESGAPFDRIARIEVHSFADVAAKMAHTSPANAIDAQFSLPHLMTCQALGLEAGLPWFTPDALDQPETAQLATRLSFHTDPEMDAAMRGVGRRPQARVELTLTDGGHHSCRIDAPLGGALRPVSAETVHAKAARLMAQAGIPHPETLLTSLADISEVEDIRPLIAPFFTQPDAPRFS